MNLNKALVTGALGIVAAGVLAGCGGGSGGGTPSAHTSTTSSTVSSAPVPATYPAKDTPLLKAPAQLQSAWTPILTYDGSPVSKAVIPGAEVLTSMPPSPPAGGDIGLASQRTFALVQWAEANVQTGLLRYLFRIDIDPRFTAALDAGQGVVDPNCDVFVSSLVVVQPSSDLTHWLGAAPQVVIDTTVPAGSACNATIAGKSVPIGLPDQANFAYGGHVQNDPPVGSVLIVERAKACGSGPQPVPAGCPA